MREQERQPWVIAISLFIVPFFRRVYSTAPISLPHYLNL